MGPVALLTHCPRGRGPSEGGWSRARGSSEGPQGPAGTEGAWLPPGPPGGLRPCQQELRAGSPQRLKAMGRALPTMATAQLVPVFPGDWVASDRPPHKGPGSP